MFVASRVFICSLLFKRVQEVIGEPKPHPRDAILDELAKSKQEFLKAGNRIENIPVGLSGYDSTGFDSRQRRMHQARRARLAPELRAQALAGKSIEAAARDMKIKCARARLIASENKIVFTATED